MQFVEALMSAEFDPREKPFFAKVHEHFRRALERTGPRNGIVDACIEKLANREELTGPEAEASFREIVAGDHVSDDQVGALLMALQPVENLPVSTITAFAKVMRQLATPIHPRIEAGEVLGDTCGTGSDTFGTFNVSTTIMFILAAAGIKIAKQGNRAVTSQCGSADVLEALGARLVLDSPQIEACIDQVNAGFIFAPEFHRNTLKNIQGIRETLAREMPRNIQRRTVFNILGPLSNPASANCQLMGVYSEQLVPKVAEVLSNIGVARGIVAFGRCDGSEVGMDEFSTLGETFYAELRDGNITTHTISPEEVGLPRESDPKAFLGGNKHANAGILRSILSNQEEGARMNLALFNAGAGLYVGGRADSIREGVDRAREVVASGAAIDCLRKFVELTQTLGK